jgi:hypothetical protein
MQLARDYQMYTSSPRGFRRRWTSYDFDCGGWSVAPPSRIPPLFDISLRYPHLCPWRLQGWVKHHSQASVSTLYDGAGDEWGSRATVTLFAVHSTASRRMSQFLKSACSILWGFLIGESTLKARTPALLNSIHSQPLASARHSRSGMERKKCSHLYLNSPAPHEGHVVPSCSNIDCA